MSEGTIVLGRQSLEERRVPELTNSKLFQGVVSPVVAYDLSCDTHDHSRSTSERGASDGLNHLRLTLESVLCYA